MTQPKHNEERHIIIYGYTREDLQRLMRHFESSLPEEITLSYKSKAGMTHVRLTGHGDGQEMLRFNLNKYQRTLAELFKEEVLSLEDRSLAELLGVKLLENEMTVASAESCTGGNVAHRIVQCAGSSSYFLGSVVSYSNEVKASVLGVSRTALDRYGAVSRQVAEEMVKGVCALMHTDCGMATTGIAGPGGGSPSKPVGTVWFAVKMGDEVVSEVKHFPGGREEIMEAATNHAMVMLLEVLRNNYKPSEYEGDE